MLLHSCRHPHNDVYPLLARSHHSNQSLYVSTSATMLSPTLALKAEEVGVEVGLSFRLHDVGAEGVGRGGEGYGGVMVDGDKIKKGVGALCTCPFFSPAIMCSSADTSALVWHHRLI